MADLVLMQVGNPLQYLFKQRLNHIFGVTSGFSNLIQYLLPLDIFHYLVNLVFELVTKYLDCLDDLRVVQLEQDTVLVFVRRYFFNVVVAHNFDCKRLLRVII